MATEQVILVTIGDPTSFQIATGLVSSATHWWRFRLLAESNKVNHFIDHNYTAALFYIAKK